MWQTLAGTCALAYALQNVLVRAAGTRKVPRAWVLMAMFAVAVVPLLAVYLLSAPHGYRGDFITWLGCSLLGNAFAFYGYVRALEASEVSLVAPLLSLSPMFMLLTSWLILAEFPDGQGLLGVLVVVAGTYALASDPGQGWLDPVRRLWRDPGCRWGLAVSAIWSVTANVDKLAVRASSPLAYATWFHAGMTLLLLGVLAPSFIRAEAGGSPAISSRVVLTLAGIGLFQAVLAGTQMYAILRTDVTYVIAVKRSGMLVSVLLGGWLLGERHPGRRFLASLVILVGLLGVMFR